jgi:acetate kinase
MRILVLNSGSSTLKFQVIETSVESIENDSDRRIAKGSVDRIGGQALLHFQLEGGEELRESQPVRNHRDAIDRVTRWLDRSGSEQALRPEAVGHRVVHGGEHFKNSVRIDEAVVRGIEDCVGLAPLHNPANLRGIRAITELFGPTMPQVAVFDTAFHSTLNEAAYLYGIPYSYYRRHKIRRYGFHGTSHRYVAYRYRLLNNLPKDDVQIVSLHLGNGCSACAIQNGYSIDTSMGMTPLEGLLMGTRSGDLDPSIVERLIQSEGLSPMEVDSLLNKQSGLLGISGLTGDMRDLLAERAENNDRRASLAIDMFCRRVRKYIGGYLALLERPQAIVFTGGIGQGSHEVRHQICANLDHLGIELDHELNRANRPGLLSSKSSRLQVWSIPTDEELLIARDTVRCLGPV